MQNPEFQDRKLKSIFFGGGTPSLAQPETFSSIIHQTSKYISFLPDVEITMEANPTSVESDKIKEFKQAGINRVSIGVQSFDERDLKFLGRKHSIQEAVNAIKIAQDSVGQDRVSLDLMFGTNLHASEPDAWKKVLETALDLGTQHISLYQLTVEKNTSFYKKHAKGEFNLPSEEIYEYLYDTAINMCAEKGLKQYEVSNFSSSESTQSKHNVQYWKSRDYIGIGPGAHSRLTLPNNERVAAVQIMQPEQWMHEVNGDDVYNKIMPGNIKVDNLSTQERVDELFLMGLRLVQEGVSESALAHHSGLTFSSALNKNILNQLIHHELLRMEETQNDKNLVATSKGIKVLNSVLSTLLD
ncbi:radical S-adenosyl methionine domain-containing protein, mitochondrial [Acrasis kona]|uniref:Radical S-adenosyl methionine domain-containing protein 1, mitochondrial n=1 Tax=Acrasis kona TaxID=1008807 RepID=A0AAW2ZE78_9EUKA